MKIIVGDTRRGVGNDITDGDARPLKSIRQQRNCELQPSRTTPTNRTNQANDEVDPLEQNIDHGLANSVGGGWVGWGGGAEAWEWGGIAVSCS